MNTHEMTPGHELRTHPLLGPPYRYIDAVSELRRIEIGKAIGPTMDVVDRSNRFLYGLLVFFIPYVLGPILGVITPMEEQILWALCGMFCLALAFESIYILQQECNRLVDEKLNKPQELDEQTKKKLQRLRKDAAGHADILQVLDHAEKNHAVAPRILRLLQSLLAYRKISNEPFPHPNENISKQLH